MKSDFGDSKASSGCTCSSTSDEEREDNSKTAKVHVPSPTNDIPPPSVQEALGTIQTVIGSQVNPEGFTEFKRLSIINESGQEDEKCSKASSP